MGSNPTPRTSIEPTSATTIIEFGLWLIKKGNRESTVKRKLKYLKKLNGTPEEMMQQVLGSHWVDKSKENAINVVCQYAEYLKVSVSKPNFRGYQNTEMYVPNPDMVKRFVYRVRKLQLKTMIMIACETGATSSEVWGLQWKDVNLPTKIIIITGVKGHRTNQYSMTDELCTLLMQLPRTPNKVFTNIQKPERINDAVEDYRKILAKETGNTDYLKIHFHTFRHYAISWHYFKTKDIVNTQRFARHCNIQNTLKYVHIIKAWIKENEFNVVYAQGKEELSKFLSEGFELVTSTEWGFCLRKPKSIA